MRKLVFQVYWQGKTCSFTKNDILYKFLYVTILLKTLMNKIYKNVFLRPFYKTGLGAASDISSGVIFRKD